jgi:hypothetical protein
MSRSFKTGLVIIPARPCHAFFETHAKRLTIEQLPAYSPDLNPIEHLWKKVKKEATHLKHVPRSATCNRKWIEPCCILPKSQVKSPCSWHTTVKSLGKWPKRHRNFTNLFLKTYR